MDINLSKEGSIAILSLSGRMDMAAAPAFEDQGIDQLDSGVVGLVVDLSSLDYVSSGGLRALLCVAKTANSRNSKMVLCSPKPFVKEVFNISGFSNVFQIFDSREEALKSIG